MFINDFISAFFLLMETTLIVNNYNTGMISEFQKIVINCQVPYLRPIQFHPVHFFISTLLYFHTIVKIMKLELS